MGEVVLGVVDGGVVHAARLGDGVLHGRAAAGVAPLLLSVPKVMRVVLREAGAVREPEVLVLVVVALHVERLGSAAALGHSVVDEVAQDGRVVEHRHAAVGRLGVGLLDVVVVGEVVLGVVDGGVVHAARRGAKPLDLGAAGSVAPLGLPVTHIVLVVPCEVGAVGGAEVGVLVVVALHVERLGAAAALGHAIVNKMLEGLVLIVFGPFSDIRIIL